MTDTANIPIGVCMLAIMEPSGVGTESVSAMKQAQMTASVDRIHHLLVRMMSMNGLHNGFITHGRYRRLV